MKLQQHVGSKLGSIIFAKILFLVFWGKRAIKWTQNEIFEDLWQIKTLYVSNFCMSSKQLKGLQ